MKLFHDLVRDAEAVTRSYNDGNFGLRELAAALTYDGTQLLALKRLREAARRQRIPLANRLIRQLETTLYGVEISRDAVLGEGVVFMHTVGIVIGGDARIGDRVIFLGSNTIGSIGKRGYPRIGNDVVIGAGARVLGPVTVGDGATIGANAVVVKDVPAGATAVGVPAVVRLPSTNVVKLGT